MKKIDMVNNIYGHLTVDAMLYNYNNTNKTYCSCSCDCGRQNVIRPAWELRNKSTDLTSCGCTFKERAKRVCGKDIDGQKFGRLKVLETLWEHNPPMVKCECDCGYIGLFRKSDIQTGHTKSCGCATKERTSEVSTKDWTGYVSESGVKFIKPLYQNNKHQWIWECECPLCGNMFQVLPIKVYNNHTTSCGCKRQSSGERIIETILKSQNINFNKEYTYDDCKYKYKLRFDFAIMDNDDKVLFLIEYDGQQHFKPVESFGGQKAFNETIVRDEIKNEYCQMKQIPLLRLNYKQSVEDYRRKINEYIKSVTTTGNI